MRKRCQHSTGPFVQKSANKIAPDASKRRSNCSQLPVILGRYGWKNLFVGLDSANVSIVWLRLYGHRSKVVLIPDPSEPGKSDAHQRNRSSSIGYSCGC